MAVLGAFNRKGPFETRLFINNEFVPARSGKRFPVIDPATEETLAHVEEASAEDVDAAVRAAAAALPAWSQSNPSRRRDLLQKLGELVEEHAEHLGQLESVNNGKPWAGEGYGSKVDVELVSQCYKYYAGWADKIHGKTLPMDGPYFACTRHEAVGVVGQIIPWNFPLLMQAWKFAPALAAGCTIVLKTSEKTPLSALAVCKLVVAAGFPPGVINVVSGYGNPAGEALCRHPLVDKVAFTGSTAVGKRILGMCAESVKRCTVELGGKSPLIVCEDADLDLAVATAHNGIFTNQGQVCCASSRIFVHESVYDAFLAKAAEAAAKRKLGDFADPAAEQGPQVDKLQFDRVLSYLDKGKAEGARVVVGGQRHGEKGFFVQPTIFADVVDTMTIAQEEIFGPVMSVLKFSTLEEAVTRANATRYGLAAGVITKNGARALRVANALRAGTVWINCWDASSHVCPFGGFKESGIGRDLGEYAMSHYTEVKTIIMSLE